MNVNGLDNLNLSRSADSIKNSPIPKDRESARLRQTCTDFEGVLLGMFLKESLKANTDDEDSSTGSDILMDYGSEQLAQDLGKADTLGIADIMYKQMSRGGVTNGK